MKNILEICVFNISTAIAAEKAGADRLELCENYANGGTTPSYGFLKTVKEKISIPVFPMIRPRGGDYFHSEDEFNIIQKDVLLCKELGFEGVVFGLLKKDGSIDTEKIKRLVEISYPLEVTFHRAFDRCINPLQSLEEIIECGCQRILTSGQVPNVINGKDLIKQLIEQADERIIIMPGSGLRSSNVVELKEFTGATEFHTSARKVIPSPTTFINEKIKEDFSIDFIDEEEIKKIKSLINQ